MRDRSYLFVTYDLRSLLISEEQKMLDEIDSLPQDRLDDSLLEALLMDFEKKYKLHLPKLLEKQIKISHEETQIDVRNEFNRNILDRSRPFYITGTQITYHVPFEGNGNLFHHRSSMIPLNPPRAEVENGELLISFSVTKPNAQIIKTQFANILSLIKQLLIGTANDVGIYNEGIRQKATNQIQIRKEKLKNDNNLISELGYPLK